MARSNILRVKNSTGSTISASKVVYVSGYDETDLLSLVSIANNNSTSTMPAVGIVREEIVDGGSGIVKISGPVDGLDTSAASVGSDVFVGRNGEIVFSNPTLSDSSLVGQFLGIVTISDDSPNGQIQLYPLETQSRIRHAELVDVTNNQHHNKLHEEAHRNKGIDQLSHSSLSDLLEHTHPQYPFLSGTFGDGYVAFFTGQTSIGGDNDLYFDRVNNRLGIRVSSPNELLTVGGSVSLLESTAPSNTTSYGKIYASSADNDLHFVDSSGNDTNLVTASDIRLKRNVNVIEGALSKIGKINGISFEWNEEAHKYSNRVVGEKRLGVIAQEVEKVIPEIVNSAKKYKSVDYEQIIPLLIEAIKELKKENEQLKERIFRFGNFILTNIDEPEGPDPEPFI